jgi:hypothetical protein
MGPVEWVENSFRVLENTGLFFWLNDHANNSMRIFSFSKFKNIPKNTILNYKAL